MTTATITTEAPQWVRELYAPVDSLDVEGFVGQLTEDVRFRFGNAPATIGQDAVREGLTQLFATIKGMHHNFLQVWEAGDSYSLVLDVDYTRMDDQVVTAPAVTVLHKHGELVDDMQIFIDIAPVFAPA
jgi:SnoaL-like domain